MQKQNPQPGGKNGNNEQEMENLKSELLSTLKDFLEDSEVSEAKLLKTLIAKIKKEPFAFCNYLDIDGAELFATIYERDTIRRGGE